MYRMPAAWATSATFGQPSVSVTPKNGVLSDCSVASQSWQCWAPPWQFALDALRTGLVLPRPLFGNSLGELPSQYEFTLYPSISAAASV